MSDKTHTGVAGINIKDSGKRQDFSTGANRDIQDGKGRFDLLPPWAIEQVAKLYQAGCQKYGDRNWEKGMPLGRYLDSALRHLFKYMRNETDEDHLLAATWNLLCILDTRERIKLGLLPGTLDDLPKHNLSKEPAEKITKMTLRPLVARDFFPHGMGETKRPVRGDIVHLSAKGLEAGFEGRKGTVGAIVLAQQGSMIKVLRSNYKRPQWFHKSYWVLKPA